MFEYTKLKQRIKYKGFNYKTLAIRLNIRQYTLEKKLNGNIEFTQNEIRRIIMVLDISKEEIGEYFFTLKV